MPGRPLYRTTEDTQIGSLQNRVDAVERRRDVSGFYEIKVFADDEIVTVGDGAFIFAIPTDLGGAKLKSGGAFVTTVSSSGLVTIQFRNINEALDLLSTRITIDANEKDSRTALTPGVINTTFAHFGYPIPNNQVAAGDQIRIDVDTAGTGAKGLGVMLGFS